MSKLQANPAHVRALKHLLCCTGLFDGEDAGYVQQGLKNLMPRLGGAGTSVAASVAIAPVEGALVCRVYGAWCCVAARVTRYGNNKPACRQW